MASYFPWLAALKSSQLQILCKAIGVNSTGTKPILVASLAHALPPRAFITKPKNEAAKSKPTTTTPRKGKREEKGSKMYAHNIVSIDMGIRNLAYCRLLLPPLESSTNPVKPTITEWKRVDISTPPSPTSHPTPLEPPPNPKEKEPFHPSTYAAHAYTLLSTLLHPTTHPSPPSPSPPQPTQILIERQRFRSMGGSAVQEWTLRVNMFEAMLYATLHTLRAEGRWEGQVWGILPGRVVKLWVPEENAAEIGGGKGEGKSARGKRLKIQVVRGWLEGGDVVELKGEAKAVGEGFLRKLEGKRGGGKKGKGGKERGRDVEMGKLDDLADCLLQGMAWVRWEENRRLVAERGVDALEVLEG